MDTRFWGPDGWKLLHSITVNYPDCPSKHCKQQYKKFFMTLPYVLPCKYCRESLDKYYNELPIDGFLSNKKTLFNWSYQIHNKVNRKLKLQGFNSKKNPTMLKMFSFYKHYLNEINLSNCINMPGWDFMYSLTFNYCTNVNKFKSKYRANQYKTFYRSLAYVLPFKIIKPLYKKKLQITDFSKVFLTRNKFKRWLYSLEYFIKKNIKTSCLSYSKCCKRIEGYRAGCGTKTCRR